MPTWMLLARSTQHNDPPDIRYRQYTTDEKKAQRFEKIPKIQFSDSGHGIIFESYELAPRTKRLPEIRVLQRHVDNAYREMGR